MGTRFATEKDLIDAVKSHWNADRDRRVNAANMLLMYDSEWRRLLEEELKKLFIPQNYKKQLLQLDVSINLLRWAATQMAIYAIPPQRTIDGEVPDGLDPYLAEGMLDMALDEISQLLFVMRELAIRPMVVEEYGEKKIVLDVVTPDQFSVVPNRKNPLMIDAIIIELPEGNDSKARYSVWTDDEHLLLSSAFKVLPAPTGEDTVNRYGVVPYLPVHALYPIRKFWHLNDSDSLYSATLTTGVHKTDLNHKIHHQSFKQLVFKGEIDSEMMANAVLDPTVAMQVKGGANTGVDVLDLQANTGEQHETILSIAASTLGIYGFRADAIKGGSDSSASGYALQIKTHRLEINREKYRTAWQLWEQRLLFLSRAIWKKDANSELPSGKLAVVYADLRPAATPAEKSKVALDLKELGWSQKRINIEILGKDDDWVEMNAQEVKDEQAKEPVIV